MTPQTIQHPTALFVGHPGHELRLFRWLEVTRPLVFVLTDGSGSGRSRILSSYELHRRTGSTSGAVMGSFTDVDVYRAILSCDATSIASATVQLAGELIAHGVESLVSDAFEFYNPTHDLCSVMAGLAVARVEALTGKRIARLDYAVTMRASGAGQELQLDDAQTDRKLAAAYAFENLTYDVNVLLKDLGIDDMRHEIVRPLRETALLPVPSTRPFYEVHGEERVAEGRYSEVLRYEEHFVPFVEALQALVVSTRERVVARPARVASS
jgi:hypothetical protein